MRASACVLVTLLLVGTGFAESGEGPAAPQFGKEPGRQQTRVAAVFGEPLLLEDLTPEDIELQRKKLPPGEFADWLRKDQGRRAYEKIWRAVLRKYVEREKIGVSNEEMAAIGESVERRLKSRPELQKDTTLSPEQRKGLMVAWSRGSLMDWKVCKSLYEKYGGRVGIGSLGAWTAWDGQTAILKEHHKAGDIKFEDAALEQAFWQHTTIKNFADAYPTGERLKQVLATPPYLLD